MMTPPENWFSCSWLSAHSFSSSSSQFSNLLMRSDLGSQSPTLIQQKGQEESCFCFLMIPQPWIYSTSQFPTLGSCPCCILNEWWQDENSPHSAQESICYTPSPLEVPKREETRATETDSSTPWRVGRWINRHLWSLTPQVSMDMNHLWANSIKLHSFICILGLGVNWKFNSINDKMMLMCR